jgi:hypothetical protein
MIVQVRNDQAEKAFRVIHTLRVAGYYADVTLDIGSLLCLRVWAKTATPTICESWWDYIILLLEAVRFA